MPEETITFELIRRIQREEQKQPKLTRLPENFYQNVSAYLQQKKNISDKDDRKPGLEFKSIERLIEDILNRRERKILNQTIITARTSIPPENMTEEERRFFDGLVGVVKERRKSIFSSVFTETRDLNNLVIFEEDVPQFVASDTKTYGPFKKGDIAKLPEDNIKVLMERGAVKEMKQE